MSRRCELTGKGNNVANNVSHSKRRTKRVQQANVFNKRIYVPSQKRWVTIKLCAQALRTIEKLGVDEFLKKAGVSL